MKPLKEFLKGLWSNRISLLGVAITTVSAIIIIIAIILNLLNIEFNPYQNLITFGFFSILFVLGLILIPLGAWLWRRKAALEDRNMEPLKIDFSNKKHVSGVLFFLVMSFLNVILFSVIFYNAYHFTESNTFCGKICHTVMSPEFIAHGRSPHSRVKCADCHIGSGAKWFVKAKISGIWQVIAVLTNSYSTPIPSPVEDLRPARDTCEQCHRPQVFHGKRMKIYKRLDNNLEINDPLITAVAINIGGHNIQTGKYEGIHWHVSDDNKVEYLAVDKKRMKIKRVRVTDGKTGKVTEYVNKDMEDPKGHAQWRVMDCIDCHNRPTHIYDDPEDAVDREIFHGNIPVDLPEIRKVSLKILVSNKYKSQEEAENGIVDDFKKYYSENYKDIAAAKEKDIVKAAKAVYGIYKNNVFPEMKITFGTYPNHIGHKDEEAGCFRCHDEEHVSKDGKEISQDCDLCHSIIVEGGRLSDLPKEISDIIRVK